jgi:hypothetical protein
MPITEDDDLVALDLLVATEAEVIASRSAFTACNAARLEPLLSMVTVSGAPF